MPFLPSDPVPLHSRRAPLTAFERGLRPTPSSNRPLALAVLGVMLLAALALWQAGFKAGETARRVPRDPAGERATPTMPTAPASPQASPAPHVERITKCLNSAGGASYSDGPCPAGMRGATVDVRPDLNLADGMTPQACEASAQQNREAAQERASHERRVALQVGSAGQGSRVQTCAALEARIAWLDAEARQPQVASRQDNLRAERKQLRDRQFALRC